MKASDKASEGLPSGLFFCFPPFFVGVRRLLGSLKEQWGLEKRIFGGFSC